MHYSSLYLFLARAFHSPPDAEWIALATDIPELRPHLQTDLKHEFTWLFEFNVYPYASVFLDPSGMLNSDWSGFVTGVYSALGLEVSLGSGLAASDHLAAQLEAMAVLALRQEVSDEEAVIKESSSESNELAKERAQLGQATLLTEQVLPWLLAFNNALKRIHKGLYAHLASMALELCLDHANDLLTTNAATFVFPEDPNELKAVQPIDAKKKAPEARSRLQELITPARSGLFLSRDDITQLGRKLNLPVRFAERAFMLENLVSSAADASLLNELFDAWLALLNTEQESIKATQKAYPNLATIWTAWLEKLALSKQTLNDLKTYS